MRSKYRHDRTPAHHDSSIDDRRIYGNYILLWTRRELIIVTFRHLSPSLSTCALLACMFRACTDIFGRACVDSLLGGFISVSGRQHFPFPTKTVVGIVSHGNYYLTAAVVS